MPAPYPASDLAALGRQWIAAWNARDLAIDLVLAHAARDQLRDLTAEIDDQNLVMC